MNQSAYIAMALIALVIVVAALVPTRPEDEADPPHATFHSSAEPLLLPCDGWLQEVTEHDQDEDGDGTDGASCLTCGTPRTQCVLDQP